MIDSSNGVTVVTTNETFYKITGLQGGQRYTITVKALDASHSVVNSVTCSGETGEG